MRRPPVPTRVPQSLLQKFSHTSYQRAGVSLLVLLFLTGCFHSQAYKAATLLNEYDFRENRFEESCLPFSTQPFCQTAKPRLDKAKRHVVEAATAVHNGGSAKLQLDLAAKTLKELSDVH